MISNKNITVEGKAKIFTGSNTFYNPVQEFNRDMSIVALTVFAEQFINQPIKESVKRSHPEEDYMPPEILLPETKHNGIVVLEALAATGLRSVRYALEVPNIKKIYANDHSLHAVEIMNQNIKENEVDSIIDAVNHDAVWLMQKLYFENKLIHAIDLDPYGCPTRFLDSAVNCIADGGILMITCTDMAVIAGNTPETCYVKYGSISLRSSACHEMALRIALQCVANHCGRYGKYIVPLLSFSADFYIRMFVQVFRSQKTCKHISSNISLVYQCTGCEMITLQPLSLKFQNNESNWKFTLPVGPPVSEHCIHCNHKHKTGGPVWTGKLHDVEFVDAMLSLAKNVQLGTSKRIYGMLSLIKEELHDIPLYYTIDLLCSKLHCQMIPMLEFRCALLNAGYRVSSSHCKTNSVKTDAPQRFIWDVLRTWIVKYPVSEKRLLENSVTSSLLKINPCAEVNFAFCKNAVPLSSANKLLRYQRNPLPNWGPGIRSKSNLLYDGNASKKVKNQNKKKRFKSELEKKTEMENKISNSNLEICT